MWQLRSQRIMTITGIFAIAMLLAAGLTTGVIGAQEATPGVSNEQQSTTDPDSGAPPQATAQNDTSDESETPPPANDDSGNANAENPAPSDDPTQSAAPSPSDQPMPPPAGNASGGGEGDQPSPSPSPAAVSSPSPSPSPTAQIWVNHDTLTPAGSNPTSSSPLPPDETVTLQFVYTVTTPRTGTTIHAELRPVSGDASGWQVRLSSLDGAGDDWSAASPVAEQSETTTTAPDITFTLTIAIRAPENVAAPSAVALFVRSTATAPDGSPETGLSGDAPLTQFDVSPPPSPSPSPVPTSAATPAAPVAATTTAACSPDATALPDVKARSSGFGDPVFDGTSYTPVTSTITVTLSLPSGETCLASNWSIAITASAMTNDAGDTIPASTITYQGVSGLTASELHDSGLPPGTPLDTAQTILTGSAQVLDAAHPEITFVISLTWSPPASTTGGHYTSTVIVTSVAEAAS